MNVPKIRFNNFSDEYEIKEVGDITISVSSGKISKQLVDGEYNVYGSMGIIGSSNFYDYDGEKVLVARVGANAGSVNKINEKCCISDNTLVLEPKNVFNDYLFYSLSHYNPKKLIFGSGQPLVTGGQLKKITIGIPDKEEQIKVSNFLSLLDKKIELQSKKIEDLKLFKLCTSKLLFKENKNIKLKEICECKTSNISLSDIENNNGMYPIYGANGEIKKISSYQIDEEYLAIIKDGAGVGKTFVCKSNSSIIGTLNALIPQNIPIYYFNELISTINFNKYIVGSGIPHIYFNDYSNEKVCKHSEDITNKADKLFKNFYCKINLEKEQLNKLQELKKGLMQSMFV